MPSHKVLKSVVASVAGSFTSLMNYSDGDYVMGHLVRAIWASGDPELRVDLISGQASPESLLVRPVADAVRHYSKRFPELVSRHRSSMNFVSQAQLVVRFDPAIKRPVRLHSTLLESPYTCTVSLTDDRGKVYTASLSGWWFPEPPRSRFEALRWRFRTWLSRITARVT